MDHIQLNRLYPIRLECSSPSSSLVALGYSFIPKSLEEEGEDQTRFMTISSTGSSATLVSKTERKLTDDHKTGNNNDMIAIEEGTPQEHNKINTEANSSKIIAECNAPKDFSDDNEGQGGDTVTVDSNAGQTESFLTGSVSRNSVSDFVLRIIHDGPDGNEFFHLFPVNSSIVGLKRDRKNEFVSVNENVAKSARTSLKEKKRNKIQSKRKKIKSTENTS